MQTIIYAVIGYFFLLLTIRVLSRRPGAQMTPFEFVLIFLIGGVVILATTGNDRSEVDSVCAVVTIALLHRLISWLKQHFPKFGALVDGTPMVLMKDGQWQTEVMDNMKIQETDVMAAARTKGLKSLRDIKYAILERNGGISIIREEN